MSMKLSYLLAVATLLQSAYAATPVQKYVGEWQPDKKYTRGTMVVLKDQTWLCMKACSANEPGANPDSWARIASTEPGPKGDTGPQGAPGIPGEQGPQGPIGPVGPQGIQGLQGVQGPVGPIGPIGPQGDRGLQGDPGPQGEQGVMGPMGMTGDTGPKGDIGARGPTGPTGPAGPVGASGGIKVYDANNQFLGYSTGGMSVITQAGLIADFHETEYPYSPYATLPDLGYLSASSSNGDGCYFPPGQSGTPDNCVPNIIYTTQDCSGDRSKNPYSYNSNAPAYGPLAQKQVSYEDEDGGLYLIDISEEKPASSFKSTLIDVWDCPNPATDNSMGEALNPWPPTKIEDDACRNFPFTVYRIIGTSSGSPSPNCPSGNCYRCAAITYTQEDTVKGPVRSFSAKPVTLPFTLPVALPLRYEVGQ